MQVVVSNRRPLDECVGLMRGSMAGRGREACLSGEGIVYYKDKTGVASSSAEYILAVD